MRILAILALLTLANCAFTTDYIDVTYGAARSQPQLPGASAVGLTVTAEDARTDHRDRVSSKRNGFGMDTAPILSTTDVVAETSRAIGAELMAKGFRLGGNDARVEVDVLRFYNEFRMGFFAGDAVSEITLNVQVLDRLGRPVYSRIYSAKGLEPNIQVMVGHNAEASLNNALKKVVPLVVDDPAFLNVLLSQGAYSIPGSISPTS
ncbi:YajG family lipoprotein [Roseomonas sp. E05]|uniref:YajG family lipoprotein n=1 Tax=Roseomonas sp. E05 TaxID=3046310 RepID=UPI0024B893F5|nr:YajG family lipoprotein [Roseomonas sp. E05]MDJ0391148.1 YajG family lipoprotein [Roseomonas sp. E05]